MAPPCPTPRHVSPTEGRRWAGAIVIVAYQGVDHLPRALDSCRANAPDTPVIVVDNGSSDGTLDRVSAEYPSVRLMPQRRNLGFAAGCNVGIRAARAAGAGWVLLLNHDATISANTVPALARFLDATPRAAAVQPAVFRDDGLVNSLGNPFHYLGFSAAGGNGLTVNAAERDAGMPWLRDARWRTTGVTIPAFSGTAAMLRVAALDDVGLFQEDVFLYN